MTRIEFGEEVRGDLGPQLIDVYRRDRRFEWDPVDQLEGPRSHPQNHIVSSQLLPPPDHCAKPNMSERAPDVGIDLDHSHE